MSDNSWGDVYEGLAKLNVMENQRLKAGAEAACGILDKIDSTLGREFDPDSLITDIKELQNNSNRLQWLDGPTFKESAWLPEGLQSEPCLRYMVYNYYQEHYTAWEASLLTDKYIKAFEEMVK